MTLQGQAVWPLMKLKRAMYSVTQHKKQQAAPTAWTLLRVWAAIGLQSFGGGASTQLLIRRTFVERLGWVGADELARMWNLCLVTPGINLIALTVLIGRKLAGPWGIVASLAGLLLPSASVTCLLAAGFTLVQHSSVVHAILRGVVPATAGIMVVVGVEFARPQMARARSEGAVAMAASIAIIALATAGLVVLKLSVAGVIVAAGVVGLVVLTRRRPDPALLAKERLPGEDAPS